MDYDGLFFQFPALEGDGVALGKIERHHAQDLFDILGDEELYRYKPGSPRKTLATVENYIGYYQRDFRKRKMLWLGIFPQGGNHLAGIAEIFDVDRKCDTVTVGYTLAKSYWGQGLATQATKLMLCYLFDFIRVNRIQAFVMPENQKSGAVLLRSGFVKEGLIRQGQFWTGRGLVDLEIYSVLRDEYVAMAQIE